MSLGTIQIPVLFDMSGDSIVFGEDATGDFVSSHLDFALDMTTEANDISLNAADISGAIRIGDQDTGDNIFYSGGTTTNVAVDELCNRIAKAITRGKLVHLPKAGDHSDSGIPMGGRAALVATDGETKENAALDKYQIKYLTSIAPIGDEQMLGEAMARVASIHLVGSPLSAGIFQDKNSVQTDLETASSQTFGSTAFYNALAVQLSKVLGGSKSSSPMNNGSNPVVVAGPAEPLPPGGDLASQNFSINFDSLTVGDSYNAGGSGASSTSTVVDGTNASHPDPRVSGSLYLRTATNQYNQAKIYYDNTTTRAISFWHHFDFIPDAQGKESLIGGIYAGGTGRCRIERRGTTTPRYVATSDANVQWWLDGVKQTTVVGPWLDTTPSAAGWHHHYIDLGPGYTGTDITQVRLASNSVTDDHSQYQNFGFFDDFRFFDERLTDAQIINLSTGANGNPGGVFPIDLASSNSSLSGQAYTASSKYDNASRYFAHDAFDGVITGVIDAWVSAANTYSNGSHNNTNANTTTDGYAGEWVQVDIGQDIVLKSFQIYPRQASGELDMTPKDMRLFSSADGTNWSQIKDWTGLTTNDWYPSSTWSSVGPYTTDTTGRYFRLVINENIGNSNYTQIGELTLNGVLSSEDAAATFYPLDASGTSVPALKSIYEQLMNIPGRSQIMDTRDISGVVDNSNVTLTGGFPFIAGDKLVMYLRPKIVFATQTFPEQFNTVIGFPTVSAPSVPVYNIGRKSTAGGVLTGQTYTESSADNEDSTANGFHRAFQGTKATDTSADPERWFSHDFHSGINKKYSETSPYAYRSDAVSETTNVDGSTTLDGEWGQVDIGQNTVINKFEIWPHLNGTVNLTNSSPATFSLLGSLDGTNWTTIKAVAGDTDWGTTGSPVDIKSYDLGELHGPYRYYRISIQNTNGSKEVVVVNELLLHGVKHPSQVVSGGSNAQPTASTITDISGLITNFATTAEDIASAFPGNATTGKEAELNKWGWMGSANSDSLSLETTDIQDTKTIDLHIWKITVTL